jgi:TonB family protein
VKFKLLSLGTHGLVALLMVWFLAHDGGHVTGSSGLVGNTRTRFDVTMESKAPVKILEKKTTVIPVADEGITLPDELPTEVKNVAVDTSETPQEKSSNEERSEGTSSDSPAGKIGQGGSSNQAADRLGDSDRTNRLGLYLQKMQRKIQANLGPAGYVEFPTRAKLLLDLRRDGNVSKISVLESSGDPLLDRLAIRAVQKSLPFDPWERDQQIQLPVVFR